MGKILELSRREADVPTDVVDLGAEHNATGYAVSELANGTNGYAKISKINGLTPTKEEPVKKDSCC